MIFVRFKSIQLDILVRLCTINARIRLGAADWTFALAGSPDHGPEQDSQVLPANENPPQYADAERSAELCSAHLRAKHLGSQCCHQSRNSGQRAGSRSCTRRLRAPFYPLRPGPMQRLNRPDKLRLVRGSCKRQVLLTAWGIGVS